MARVFIQISPSNVVTRICQAEVGWSSRTSNLCSLLYDNNVICSRLPGMGLWARVQQFTIGGVRIDKELMNRLLSGS
jgi:hypothetical protein